MEDNPKQQPVQEPEKEAPAQKNEMKKESVSAFRNAMELSAREKREAELKERQRQAQEAEEAYQAREEYAKELAEEKVDLIRLKQGVISDSDKIFKDTGPEKHYTLWQRIGNWFYHAKWWLGIATFCAFVAAFLIYDYVTRDDPDLLILVATQNQELYAGEQRLCAYLQTLCEDYNGDGEIKVEAVYIPVSKNSMENGGVYMQSYNTQLLMQFQTCSCMLVLTDADAARYMEPETTFDDLSALYPDRAFIDGYKLNITETNFSELWDYTGAYQPDSFLTLRRPFENMQSLKENEEAYAKAKALLDKLVAALHTVEGDQ